MKRCREEVSWSEPLILLGSTIFLHRARTKRSVGRFGVIMSDERSNRAVNNASFLHRRDKLTADSLND